MTRTQLKELRKEITTEMTFLNNVLSVLSIPSQQKGDNDENLDYEMVAENRPEKDNKTATKRAQSIAELEEKLAKLKSQNNKFNLKNKLAKKSLSSKLNKKIKKKERLNKTVKKPTVDEPLNKKPIKKEPANVNIAKPVFNTDGKLVFSKFDFANVGNNEKQNKTERDPKKILDNLKQQEAKIRQLEESEEADKAKEVKEKIAWKSALQKAEGQKVKDDPTLLKKSIKKMEQKKKHSKKQWDNRIEGVAQKKEDRQKKRRENISKKKKEKKAKVVKTAIKRGRVVI